MSIFACDVDSPFENSYVRRTASYPFPFLDPASQAMPKTWRDVYNWGKMCLSRAPEFVDANKKLYSYFATQLEVTASSSDDQELDTDEQKAWVDLFVKELGYLEILPLLGVNIGCFGSQIISLQNRGRRILVCPHPECGFTVDLLQGVRQDMGIDFQFKYATGQFLFRCPAPNCPNRKRRVPAIVKDWHTRDPKDMSIKLWPADEMLIDYYVWTDRDDIYWKIPEYYKQAVRKGHLETIAEADLDVLDAIRKNKLFRFYRERVFHAKDNIYNGLNLRGRGLPRAIAQGPQIWSMQVLRRQNQVLSMDYLIPLGFFSLDDTPKGGEYAGPMGSVNPNQFANDINAMLNAHREDPTRRGALPYAVRYQMAGGEAAQYAPTDMLQMAGSDIYEGSGLPIEMWRGSLQLQVMPVAARLFEAQHQTIPGMFNRLCQFLGRRVSEELDKPEVTLRHIESTIVGDLQRQMILFQGRQMGDVSAATFYQGVGVDPSVERDRVADETIANARAQKKVQQELDGEQLLEFMRQPPPPPQEGGQDPAAMGGMGAGMGGMGGSPMPAGMAPSQGLAVDGMNMQEMSAEAERLAMQLVDPSIPQAQVNQELSTIRSQSPELHTLVRGAMDRLRQQAATAGQNAILSGQM